MSYQATVIPIMIASPGDVSAEREIVRAVIHDWNDVNSFNAKTMLAPLGWETHSAPELGDRPQAIINKRLLKKCDLLIGVFWTRLGTPTGEAASGTVEEIMEHVNAGKPAMIYFSSKPAAPESIDPDQLKLVQEFKEQCRKMGLVETFDDEREFKEKLAKQLQVTLINNEYLKQQISSTLPRVVEPRRASTSPEYVLSADAKQLLTTAAAIDGTIMKLRYMGGRHIQAGGKIFGSEGPMEAAKWESALNELRSNQLVHELGYKGEVFELTHKGWELAKIL